jgi:NADH-quinone oxidoreductase subunit J
MISLLPIIFYLFAALTVAASLMVVMSRDPVPSALFLVLAFFTSSVLWMLLEAEFLALVLVLVYVGAVMTLFLFVVMTLPSEAQPARSYIKLPLTILGTALLIVLLLQALRPAHFFQEISANLHTSDYSNVKALGSVLYTEYAYPFEVAGVLLLVAIIAAISLSMKANRNRKVQQIPEQITVRREDRVRIVKMAAVKKGEL